MAKDQEKGIRAQSVVADKAYDSEANHRVIEEAGMKPEIPFRHRHKQAFSFRYRPRKDAFRCPAGKDTVGKSPHQGGGYLYYFSQADCSRCKRKESCLGRKETRKRVYLSQRARHLLLHRPQLREALRYRKIVERKFAEAKCWHGLGRARYHGRWRVAIQVLMIFLVLNLKLMARLLGTG